MANEEVEFAVNRIANAARIRKVLLPDEIKDMTRHLSFFQKKAVMKKLGEMKFDLRENMVKFNDEVVSYEEITDNQIFNELVKPEFVSSNSDVVQVGSSFYRGISAVGFPAKVKENWLGSLAQDSGNIDFSMFIEPASKSLSFFFTHTFSSNIQRHLKQLISSLNKIIKLINQNKPHLT